MINENIYGAPETWLNAPYVGGGRMTTKCANFTGGINYLNSSTLGVGNSNGKTPHGELIDRTICTVALGTESIYSHMSYYMISDTYTDDEQVTEFFYSVNDGQRSFTTQRSFYDTNHPNFWKVYTPSTPYNYSDNTIPITDLNPQKILYRLEVCPCKANGTIAPFSYTQSSEQYIYISDYDNNVRNIKTDYPYIMAARLVPYIDTSATSTPNRSRLSAADAGFGIAINREFTAVPNDELKINYCQFRNTQEGTNVIPLYGYKGYFPNAYCILLADTSDIQTAIVDYSNEQFIAHEYDSGFHDWLIKQAACFGVYVQAFGGTPDTVTLDDDSIILGVIDSQGIGHGEFTRGAANRDNDIWNWDSYSESPYDWTKPIDPNTYSDETTFNFIGGLSSMFKRYVLNAAGVDALGQQLFKIGDDIVVDQSDSYQDYQEIILNNFLTNNPIDAIISLKKYPLANIPHVDTSEQLRLGKKQISVVGYRFPYTNFKYLFGAISVHPRFENTFLDYAPFTTLELYVPFCGTKELDTGVYMGHRLSVELQIDFTTGNCDAYIKCDNLVTDTLSGQCAIDIPVTGTESATVDSQITNGIIQGKAARGKATTDFASANFSPGGWIKSITNPFDAASNRFENKLNRAGAEYNVTHTQTPLRSVGTSTPVGGWTIDFNCRLFITYPTGSVINNNNPPSFNDVELKQYGHINGFATVEASTMSNYKIEGEPSFVVADSINLDGIAATETEKDLIRAACKEGCYI